MDHGPDSLALRFLRQLTTGVGSLREDMREKKQRLGCIEEGLACVSRRVDRIDDRVDRIDRRLNLVEA